MYAKGSQLPVVTNINPINPIGTLADGRPIYSTTASAATRLDPRFNLIQQVQSIGESTFKSMTLQARPSACRTGSPSTCSIRSAKGSTTRRC